MLPSLPGTYVLVLHVERDLCIPVARKGLQRFVAGDYLYVGSAHGPGGLAARIGRHLRRSKSMHWHIDYLLQVASIVSVWYAVSSQRLECRWAEFLRSHALIEPWDAFGASDCSCATHLFHVLGRLEKERLWQHTPEGMLSPDHSYVPSSRRQML